ncbi:hypothetical protein [Rubinisphaera italica]|uniref:Uncharacterized protein n=1 Tax=Rubinisphaera italica TaxID=2527969 RepID=A0A5C5X918_9PLAN|nr:hypothetical protein [Rubinisphaera italica]TWT59354.1 hypothetical protein Pan54_00550 [Rubinisphaera italica]
MIDNTYYSNYPIFSYQLTDKEIGPSLHINKYDLNIGVYFVLTLRYVSVICMIAFGLYFISIDVLTTLVSMLTSLFLAYVFTLKAKLLLQSIPMSLTYLGDMNSIVITRLDRRKYSLKHIKAIAYQKVGDSDIIVNFTASDADNSKINSFQVVMRHSVDDVLIFLAILQEANIDIKDNSF